MARLSHILAEEIYAHQEERLNQINPWSDVNEIEEWSSSEELTAEEYSFLQMNSDDDKDLNQANTMTSKELEYFWNAEVLNDSEEFELFGYDLPEMEYYRDY
eukprot:GFUD01059614.1.p1 GENE.GFUD01059614.1~~GFUD01059614.1.p1  ORF type:complete len:114 (-),score=36.47 GFUD01059614.1:48-353(-)